MKIFLVQFFCVFFHLFLISSASVRSIPFLSFMSFHAHLCMKCSLGVSNFLEEISSLSHSVVFLHFFLNWWLRKAFLSLLTILWNSAFRCFYFSFSALLFSSILFTAICKASPDSHFAFLHFFSLGMVLIPVSCTMSQTFVHSSSGTLSIKSKEWWLGGRRRAERSYSTFKVRRGGDEEIPLV